MKKTLALFFGFCLMLAVSATAAQHEKSPAMSGKADAPKVTYGMKVGDNIKPVTVESLDGKEKVELNKVKKKTVFLMISSVCTACRTEIKEIAENLEKFTKRDVDVYGVVIDIDPAGAAKRIGKTPFPLLADSEYKIGGVTNLMSTPSTLIVQNGKILYTKSGYRPGQWKEYLKK
jgi:peroxiredoxin